MSKKHKSTEREVKYLCSWAIVVLSKNKKQIAVINIVNSHVFRLSLDVSHVTLYIHFQKYPLFIYVIVVMSLEARLNKYLIKNYKIKQKLDN